MPKAIIKSVLNLLNTRVAVPLVGLCSLIIFTPNARGNAMQVRGAAAITGELQTSAPPRNEVFQGWRAPLWLGLDAHANDRLSLHVAVQFGFAPFPDNVAMLGGDHPASDPWALAGGWGAPPEVLGVSQAYLSYRSSFGEITAGRVPRHWGWGLWRNSQLNADTRVLSSSDSLGLSADITPSFSATVYFEKGSEGNSFSRSDDADGFTVEALLADDPTEASPQGISREVGFSFHQYNNRQTRTELNVIDGYWKVYLAKTLLGGEVLFPSGKTRNPSYAWLGGQGPCTPPGQAPQSLTCDSQKIEGFALYLKTKFLLNDVESSEGFNGTLAGLELAKDRLPTARRPVSHLIGVSGGYTAGDSDTFKPVASRTDGIISSVPLNPNFRPSLLMFSGVRPAVAGLPSGALHNAAFAVADYAYESPTLGQVSPAIIWGGLTEINKEDNGQPGAAKPLGIEVDLSYSYKTLDNVKWSLDSGVWLPGSALHTKQYQKSGPVFGLRASLITQF